MSKNAVAKVDKSSDQLVVPSFLKDFAGMGVEGVDNVKDSIPSIRLMHPLSTPVVNGEARPGDYCHVHNKVATVLGPEIVVVPVFSETGWTLWNPSRGENNSPLARGRRVDGRWVWDPSHTKFEVKIGTVTEVWNTAGSIEESGLAKWKESGGVSIAPPAKESINVLFALPDMDGDLHGVMSFYKSAFAIGRRFVSTISSRSKAAPSFAQKYKIGSTMVTAKNGNKILVPTFEFTGVLDDEAQVRSYYDSYVHARDNGLYGSDQSDDTGFGGDAASAGREY